MRALTGLALLLGATALALSVVTLLPRTIRGRGR